MLGREQVSKPAIRFNDDADSNGSVLEYFLSGLRENLCCSLR